MRSSTRHSASTTAGSNCEPAWRRSSASANVLAGRLAVGAVGGHRLERVGGEDDPRLEGDGVAGEAVRVAAAVEALVVVAHPVRLERHVGGLDDVEPEQRVALHHLVLVVGEPAGLVEDRVGHADLADVVQQAGQPHARQAVALEAELGGDHARTAARRSGSGCGCRSPWRRRPGPARWRACGCGARPRPRGRRPAGLHVGPVDRDVLVDALGADQREVGLAHQLVLGAELERLGDARGDGERDAVVADCVAARRRWANSIAP